MQPTGRVFLVGAGPGDPGLLTVKALEVLRQHHVPVAGVVVNRVLPDEPLGDFLESRRGQEAEYLARIEGSFAGLPRVTVPLLSRDVEGLEGDEALPESPPDETAVVPVAHLGDGEWIGHPVGPDLLLAPAVHLRAVCPEGLLLRRLVVGNVDDESRLDIVAAAVVE